MNLGDSFEVSGSRLSWSSSEVELDDGSSGLGAGAATPLGSVSEREITSGLV